jgi:hypothetical protein
MDAQPQNPPVTQPSKAQDRALIWFVAAVFVMLVAAFVLIRSHYLRNKLGPSRGSEVALIDLAKHYNASTRESTLDPSRTNSLNTLRQLPLGTNEFAGVRFWVNGLIQLASKDSVNWSNPHPAKVEGIRVERCCRQIHLLHGTGFWSPDGIRIAALVLHYENGRQQKIPIVYGPQVRDWWQGREDPAPAPGSAVAWTGVNQASSASNSRLRLYRSTYANPLPRLKIETIDYVSTLSQSAPFLCGLSVE